MKKILFCISVLALSLQAADRIEHFSISEAIKENEDITDGLSKNFLEYGYGSNSKLAKEKVIVKDIKTIKRTNAAMRGADGKKASCQRAFISALLAFDARVNREGGKRAANIVSYHKKKVYDSKDEFECAIGSIMVAVTLKGDVVK